MSLLPPPNDDGKWANGALMGEPPNWRPILLALALFAVVMVSMLAGAGLLDVIFCGYSITDLTTNGTCPKEGTIR